MRPLRVIHLLLEDRAVEGAALEDVFEARELRGGELAFCFGGGVDVIVWRFRGLVFVLQTPTLMMNR
jgi:hypothetical protein